MKGTPFSTPPLTLRGAALDRCSGSERRPNLDHHVSNPSPHFDPAAGAFLRRPTVPRRLGRKTLRCPRRWRGGPDRHFSVGRQPQPAGWVPGPATVAYRDGFPVTPFCFCMLSGHSPLSARPRSFVFRSGDRRTAQSTSLLVRCPCLRSLAAP